MTGNEPWDVWIKASISNTKLLCIKIELTNHEKNLCLFKKSIGMGLVSKNRDLSKPFILKKTDRYGGRGRDLFAKYKPYFGKVWVHAHNYQEPKEFDEYEDFIKAVEKQLI